MSLEEGIMSRAHRRDILKGTTFYKDEVSQPRLLGGATMSRFSRWRCNNVSVFLVMQPRLNGLDYLSSTHLDGLPVIEEKEVCPILQYINTRYWTNKLLSLHLCAVLLLCNCVGLLPSLVAAKLTFLSTLIRSLTGCQCNKKYLKSMRKFKSKVYVNTRTYLNIYVNYLLYFASLILLLEVITWIVYLRMNFKL